MSIEDDTEWLRKKLSEPDFHKFNKLQWVAVRDKEVVYQTDSRDALQEWLGSRDPERECVLAFCDDGNYV